LKVAAESDREGFIEYKLKLIDPSGERFERLVTQLMWRLKQGRNEAIYEIGLAGEWWSISYISGSSRPIVIVHFSCFTE
jgi:GTPase